MKYFLLVLTAHLALAQPPRVSNARMETRAAGNLQATLQSILAAQEAPAWVAYTVPATPGEHNSCCWNDGYRGCALEGGSQRPVATTGPVLLEGSSQIVVLFRVASHAIDRFRTVAGDCELDAGGLPFLYLTGARPAESIALLESQVTEKSDRQIAAIAMHGDPAADAALERLAAPGKPEKIREKTLFWLGSSQRQGAFDTLKQAALKDASDNIRDKAMFALSVSKNPGAVDTLIEAAKNDKSPRVRGQALFWLAHKAGQKETAAIAAAVDNDPELAVKKKALFALTQLPKDEGVPKLIEIARSNRAPEIRKQAMFWLGQSKDPRALSFFQEVLK